jgi:hypothetical protein
MINNFYKTRLVYKVLDLINTERDILKRDLVAYSNDPVRYARRFRMLTNLAEYEFNLLTKIRNFESDDPSDLLGNPDELDALHFITAEIQAIVDTNA